MTADGYGRQVLGIREDDIVYSAANLFFAYGLGNAMTFPFLWARHPCCLPDVRHSRPRPTF